MNLISYPSHLQMIYQGEVLGEAMYGALALLSSAPELQRKWKTLAMLETQTKKKLLAALQQVGADTAERRAAQLLGLALGVVLGSLPRSASLRALAALTRSTESLFMQLARRYADRDKILLRELLVHEQAQTEFAQRELAGDLDSLAPVVTLLS